SSGSCSFNAAGSIRVWKGQGRRSRPCRQIADKPEYIAQGAGGARPLACVLPGYIWFENGVFRADFSSLYLCFLFGFRAKVGFGSNFFVNYSLYWFYIELMRLG